MPPTPPTAPPHAIPGRIGAVLKILQAFIAHARQFAATATARAAAPEFATAAAVFGTYDLPVILHRMQRGMLRALALQRYLLARAARGRNLRFIWPRYVDLQPHHRPPAKPAPSKRILTIRPRRKEPALLGPDDPGAFYLPTPEELDAEVRRRPIGRTITYICMDLGITPTLSDPEFWIKVEKIFRRYGGNFDHLDRARAAREKTFQAERDRRPETWHIDWQDMRKSSARLALGYLIGEADQTPCLPAIVPS